jgi:hypothetical protein
MQPERITTWRITPELSSFELLMRILAARADGELPAWEGLRVVRERLL